MLDFLYLGGGLLAFAAFVLLLHALDERVLDRRQR